ncbi:hypothetical protein B2J88_20200 [Rhodococcus sp. SRB_17]|uniref:hypothetical protein n=1 Tax=Acidovorax sp. SRB_24 TaxID=1962700 RepID=UPI00145CA03C|nr:hypothetical protein [Acidovorax sp. SRB_24]NMM75373.1 hypothetical protein [Acidovorax sp. SRB_24]NMM86660.1 hypothetical protein [Rhodococcus sp. SRB_17]
MSKRGETLVCPVCSAEVTFEQLLGHLEAERTFDRLVSISVPLGNLVLQYLTLFVPEKQRLTNTKKLRLVGQLLPDIERKAITHKGRDWDAPLPAWAQAIEQMLSARANDRLSLPMTGHAYLYAILAALADKHEAAAEQKQEQERRTGPRPAITNEPTHVAQALAPRPAPVMPAAPAGPSPTVRRMREEIERKKKGQA